MSAARSFSSARPRFGRESSSREERPSGSTVKPLCLGFGTIVLALGAIMPFEENPAQRPAPPPATPSRQTGLLHDDVYLRHLAGNTGHPERPERLTAIRNGLEKAGVLQSLIRIAPRRATDQELALVHSPSYLAVVRRELSNLEGLLDLSTGDTLVSPGSLDAAYSAAGRGSDSRGTVYSSEGKKRFCPP